MLILPMRIVHFDRKTGEMKLLLERLEDLWHLERVLRPGDLVTARTWRSVKFGEGKEEKKPVTIALRMESAEFAEYANRLRVGGTIEAGTPEEFVQRGRHHTFEFGPGSKPKVTKKWKEFEVSRLKKAVEETKRPVLRIIAMDEEHALTAVLRGYGVSYGPEFEFHGSKKEGKYEEKLLQYYGDVAAFISKHPEKFIVAGPGFAKDGLRDFIKKKEPALLERMVFETCSYAERTGVNELLKGGVVARVAGEAQVEREETLMEEFMVELHRDSGLACYGLGKVKDAVAASAVEKLLVLDEALRKSKEVEDIVEAAEKKKAEVVFFSESDAAQKLKGFGGLVALLRFRID